MAIAYVGSLGTAQNKTASTSFALTTTASAAAGDLVCVWIAKDNAFASGNTNEILSVSDSAGNTYTELLDYTGLVAGASTTTAGATVAVALYACKLTSALASGGTITASLRGSTAAKTMRAEVFSMPGTLGAVEYALGDHNLVGWDVPVSGSLTNREHLVLYILAIEDVGITAMSVSSPTASVGTVTTSGGGSASNIGMAAAYRIFTGTSSVTGITGIGYGSNDFGTGIAVIYEVPAGPTSHTLGGNATGVATATGALAKTAPLAGNAVGLATSTGALSVVVLKELAGNAVGVSTATGALTNTVPLAGNATGLGTSTGALSLAVPLASSSVSVATATGAASVSKPLAGSATSVGTATGALTVTVAPADLAGAATSVATATGAVSVSKPLAGDGLSVTSSTGALTLAKPLAANAFSQATATGALASSSGLLGIASAVATATGALTLAKPLAASASSVASSTGGLLLSPLLAGSASALATATGAISLSKPLAGSALSEATATGALTSTTSGLSRADSFSVTDATPAFSAERPLSDSVTATEALTSTWDRGLTPADSVTTVDTPAFVVSYSPSANDAVSVAETLTFDVSKVLTDAITASEAAGFPKERAFDAAITVVDQTYRQLLTKRFRLHPQPAKARATVVSSRPAPRATYSQPVARAQLDQSGFYPLLADSVTATDAIHTVRAPAPTDTVGLSDSIATLLVRQQPASDTFTAADSASLVTTWQRAPQETTTATDTFDRTATFSRTFGDSVSATDSAVVSPQYYTTLSDSFTVTESLAVAIGRERALSDTSSVSDSLQLDWTRVSMIPATANALLANEFVLNGDAPRSELLTYIY